MVVRVVEIVQTETQGLLFQLSALKLAHRVIFPLVCSLFGVHAFCIPFYIVAQVQQESGRHMIFRALT